MTGAIILKGILFVTKLHLFCHCLCVYVLSFRICSSFKSGLLSIQLTYNYVNNVIISIILSSSSNSSNYSMEWE
jgi:hypothetical protein